MENKERGPHNLATEAGRIAYVKAMLRPNKLQNSPEVQEPKFRRFVVVHQHNYGTTLYQLKSFKDLETYIDEENGADDKDQILSIIDICGIDFEVERGETLQIIETGEEYII